MQEIKFRAWNTESKEMLYDIQDCEDYNCTSCFAGYLNSPIWIPLQYTGLKDKNGKEIYEGDIVDFETSLLVEDQPNFKDNGKIVWCGECASFHVYGMYHDTLRHLLNLKIIGNIYETPELFE